MTRVNATLPDKLLIVRLGAIGDVVNALVVATAIRSAWPAVRIGWAVHQLAAPLVQGHPAVDRVHLWRKGAGPGGLRALLGEVRKECYPLALDLQRIFKSAALARASGAARVIGFDRTRSKEGSWLLTSERVAPLPAASHMVDRYLQFVRHLGIRDATPRLELPRDPAAAERARARIDECAAAPLLIHLGATKPANRWPAERFGQLAREVHARWSIPVAFTGGEGEREAGRRAREVEPRAHDWTGATSLLELVELQRRACAVVSCDSGPMHTAVAAGARVVALFGAADERRTGPYGAQHRVVRTLPACAPCNLRICSQPRHDCMLDLTVERVLEALGQVLERG